MKYRKVTLILKRYSEVIKHMLDTTYQLTKVNKTLEYFIYPDDHTSYDVLVIHCTNKNLAHEIELLINATINTLEYIQYGKSL